MTDKKYSASEYELKLRYGDGVFEEGMRCVEAEGVSEPEDLGRGMTRYIVSHNGVEDTVLFWTRDGSDEPDVMCSCRGSLCKHMAAAEISMNLPFDDLEEFEEEEDYSDILDMIDGLDDRISEDPDFNEDAHFYGNDYWWERKYGTYGVEDNEEIRREAVEDVLSEIFSRYRSPDTIVYLINRLSNYCGEYTGDSVDDCISEHEKELTAMLGFVSEKTVADCISESKGCYGGWVANHIDSVPREVSEAAVGILKKSGCSNKAYMSLLRSAGDLDSYADMTSSLSNLYEVLNIVASLRSEGKGDRAREILRRTKAKPCGPVEAMRLAGTMADLGMEDEAGRLFTDAFMERPCSESLDGASTYGPMTSGELVSAAVDGPGFAEYSTVELAFLARSGASRRVAELVESRISKGDQGFDWNASTLCRALILNGEPGTGAAYGRHYLREVLFNNRSDSYADAAELLRWMDSVPELESLPEPQSEFVVRLRADRPRNRKFWGLYGCRR